jgi:hypothetical protein
LSNAASAANASERGKVKTTAPIRNSTSTGNVLQDFKVIRIENWTSVLNGRFTIMFADTSRLEGNFVNNKVDGIAKYIWDNNDVYIGLFNEKLRLHDPCGQWISHEGHRYMGSFKDGYFHGVGVYFDIDGSSHHGNWEKDLPCGVGVRFLPDMTKYEGTFYYVSGDFASGRIVRCDVLSSLTIDERWFEGRKKYITDISPLIEPLKSIPTPIEAETQSKVSQKRIANLESQAKVINHHTFTKNK